MMLEENPLVHAAAVKSAEKPHLLEATRSLHNE